MAAHFNPQEQTGLLGLLTALRGGMPGSTAYQFLGDILTGQQDRVQANADRMTSLTDMLAGQAQQGSTYRQDKILADAYTPGAGYGDKVAQLLSSLYPQQGQQAPTQNYPQTNNPMPGQQQGPTLSPLFQPDPMAELQHQQAQVDLAGSIAEQTQAASEQAAAAAQAPMVASAFAQAAVAKLYPRTSTDPANPTPIAAQTPAQIIQALVISPEYANLDTQTQATVMRTTTEALKRVALRLQQQGGVAYGPGGQPGAASGAPGGQGLFPGEVNQPPGGNYSPANTQPDEGFWNTLLSNFGQF